MALFGGDKDKKAKDTKKAAKDEPKRLISKDNIPELKKFFEPMQEPVELLVFTDPKQNVPYNGFMESLCRELAEITDKITARFETLESDAARQHGVDFSPTLLLAPDRYKIRYLGAPLGEEARTLIETILRISVGKSGLGQTSQGLLKELTEERHIQVFVNPSCPYCPGQVANAFHCAIERPDLVSADCVDASQHIELAQQHQIGSVPHTIINDEFSTLGLLPEERFVAELVTLKTAEEFLGGHHELEDGGQDVVEVDVVVAGAGPAGLTAAMYAARSGLSAVVLEKNVIGGQVALTPVVENYPGFANVPGKRLMEMIADQARGYAQVHEGEGIEEVKVGRNIEVYTDKTVYLAKALILATGATWKKLGVPGEDRYFGFGVSYCSTCDGYLYKEKKAVIVGGGDTALTDALHLKNLGVDVTVIHRRQELRAEKYLQDAVAKAGVALLLGSVVTEILGDDKKVTAVKVKNVVDDSEQEITTDAVFVAIGLEPNTAIAEELGLKLDKDGFIRTDRGKRTSIPRIYAAGDVTAGARQIVTAVGDGSTAALSAFEDLSHPYWKKEKA
ncbi:FAD-dependent pyridine nucleotide-disulfide oxidoreductase [Solidesulfovibrio fructosivorans JJ]]|uniref:FAD-dependent pyridine nucleotide-disulfide oxidoreductase n=1 Tax=Solidesulfovibrio fructosivorans JJ] TaxID=596151 RepID=E1K2P3_SOLFR|nr:FAD-dependent oxidoreductase [Solidesulfovibrio fructosivorans]EFL49115.1 FAD-dependent pyridine nucleotide-disulfide oxidoreductase [Solidesulfovibrio fructosivorans JJ]]